MSQCFPNAYEPFSEDFNVKVDSSNYAAKTDIKNISYIVTPSFALKPNLAILKTEVGKLDIDKLKILRTNLSNLKSKADKWDTDKLASVPVDLSKLSNVVKNEVAKKTEYNAKIKNIEDKIPNITNLATKNALNTKVNKIETEIPSISSLATTSALTAVPIKYLMLLI